MVRYKGFLHRRKCRGCSSPEARLYLSSRRYYPFVVSPPFLRYFAQKLNRASKQNPLGAFGTHFAPYIDEAPTVFAQPWPGAGEHGRSADSPTAARRVSARVLPLDAYGGRRGCSVATRKRIRVGRNVCNATLCYVIEGENVTFKKKTLQGKETLILHMICLTKLACVRLRYDACISFSSPLSLSLSLTPTG